MQLEQPRQGGAHGRPPGPGDQAFGQALAEAQEDREGACRLRREVHDHRPRSRRQGQGPLPDAGTGRQQQNDAQVETQRQGPEGGGSSRAQGEGETDLQRDGRLRQHRHREADAEAEVTVAARRPYTSSITVTGPSLISATPMQAPKTPFLAPVAAQNRSYSGSASSPEAACI